MYQKPSDLHEAQVSFVADVADLIEYLFTNGYEATFGETYRTPEQAALNAKNGSGITNSLHTRRLAIDLNVFRIDPHGDVEYLTKSEDLKELGQYWKGLRKENAWGGDFSRPDGNHFSRSWKGIK